MTRTEKKQCDHCMYSLIVAGFAILMTFLIPMVDRYVLRSVTGTITAVASLVGVIVCLYAAKWMSKGNRFLSRRLEYVYIMTGFIFLCTAAFGIMGILKPEMIYWDIVYYSRTLAVCLEVLAIFRFVQAAVSVGK